MPCFPGNIIKRKNTCSAHKSILQFGWYLFFLRAILCFGSLKSLHYSEFFLSKYQKITPLESGVKCIAFIAMMRPFQPHNKSLGGGEKTYYSYYGCLEKVDHFDTKKSTYFNFISIEWKAAGGGPRTLLILPAHPLPLGKCTLLRCRRWAGVQRKRLNPRHHRAWIHRVRPGMIPLK